MLQNITIILTRPRFPENIGMVARAMANMGASDLVLIDPERWEREKAAPLATTQGLPVLDNARVEASLEQALAPCTLAIGTTARLGGWRKDILTPEKTAVEARCVARQGGRVALVFGSEDRGLENSEVEQCSHLAHVPTAVAKSSLNLAQAVLIMLYECVKADMALPFSPASRREWTRASSEVDSRLATVGEETMLLETLQKTLMDIDFLPKDNPNWFMQPMRRFLRKSRLRRHEFDMLMGICRQINGKCGIR